MAKAINLKLTSLICAASLASVGTLTPAAKAIEVDPNPNDGKCYFIENDLTINYNEGTEYAAILNANPWIGNSDIAKEAASIFNTKTNQNWRFAWKATSGNNDNGQTNPDSTKGEKRDFSLSIGAARCHALVPFVMQDFPHRSGTRKQ